VYVVGTDAAYAPFSHKMGPDRSGFDDDVVRRQQTPRNYEEPSEVKLSTPHGKASSTTSPKGDRDISDVHRSLSETSAKPNDGFSPPLSLTRSLASVAVMTAWIAKFDDPGKNSIGVTERPAFPTD
jgi:hypothetical protein